MHSQTSLAPFELFDGGRLVVVGKMTTERPFRETIRGTFRLQIELHAHQTV